MSVSARRASLCDWPLVRLDSVAAVNPEQVARQDRTGPFHYLDIASVYGLDGPVGLDRLKLLDWADAPSRAQRRVRDGDVLVSTVRPYLRGAARATGELDGVVASTGFAVIRASSELVLAGFLWALVRSEPFIRHLVARQSGSNYPAVRPSDVADYEFALPPVADQAEIVRVIAAADAAVTTAQGHVADAEQLARAMRADAMNDRESRAPLSELAEVTMGRQRSPKHAEGDHVIPYMRAANVKDGRLELGDVLSMNFDPGEQAKFALRQGDVLVTEGCGSLEQIGASAKWQADLDDVVCFQNTLLRLRAIEGVSDPEYVYQWARWAFEASVWADVASGTNIFHIGATRASAVDVPAQSLDAQQRIGSRLRAADAAAEAARGHLDDLRQLRSSALEAMLGGAGKSAPGARAEVAIA